MTRSQAAVLAVGVGAGALVAVLVVLAGRALTSHLTVGEVQRSEICVPAPGSETGDGVCVQRWTRQELLFVPGERQLRIYFAEAGTASPGRYVAVSDPFNGPAGTELFARYTQAGDLEVAGTADTVRLTVSRNALIGLSG